MCTLSSNTCLFSSERHKSCNMLPPRSCCIFQHKCYNRRGKPTASLELLCTCFRNTGNRTKQPGKVKSLQKPVCSIYTVLRLSFLSHWKRSSNKATGFKRWNQRCYQCIDGTITFDNSQAKSRKQSLFSGNNNPLKHTEIAILASVFCLPVLV